jgi:hypothetical protein
MLSFRLARPANLIDVNVMRDLSAVEDGAANGGLTPARLWRTCRKGDNVNLLQFPAPL